MNKLSRRTFFTQAAQTAAAAGLAISPALGAGAVISWDDRAETSTESLNGIWSFKLDPDKEGESRRWYQPDTAGEGWIDVTVPHTWQVSAQSDSYLGTAWYRRRFGAPSTWANKAVRIEFEAAYHSAKVWLNGKLIVEHIGKGYTAFTLDTSSALRVGESNEVVVSVDNSLDEDMLPRGDSFDWTPDGGLIRPVSLLISPPVLIERIDADAFRISSTSAQGWMSGWQFGTRLRQQPTLRCHVVLSRARRAARYLRSSTLQPRELIRRLFARWFFLL